MLEFYAILKTRQSVKAYFMLKKEDTDKRF